MTAELTEQEARHLTEPLDHASARELTGRIVRLVDAVRESIDGIGALVTEAYGRRAWQSLGYDSWDAYCRTELGTDRLRLTVDERRGVVAEMRSSAMPTRAIGAAIGASEGTVRNDLATAQDYAVDQPERVLSLDGRSRPATPAPTTSRRSPPPPAPPLRTPEQDNAETTCAAIGLALINLTGADLPEWRASIRHAWAIGSIGATPLQRDRVTPDNMRAVAAGLVALADEWEQT